jgi:hypothetical protein
MVMYESGLKKIQKECISQAILPPYLIEKLFKNQSMIEAMCAL